MEELELQVENMTQRIAEMSTLIEKLTKHNQQLEEENDILRNRPSQCTCYTRNANATKYVPFRQGSVIQERKTPVCGVTEKSAELPQPRAVTLQAAALWVLFLRIALYCQLGTDHQAKALTAPEMDSLRIKHPSNFLSKELPQKWMFPHQPPWNQSSLTVPQ